MAARRLILVMLVLLVLSSAVAALVPVEPGEDPSSTTPSATPASDPPEGKLVTARIRADGGRPEKIRAREGDQLELKISSSRPGQVEIVALGVFETVDPLMPATVDLLLVERGAYPMRFLPPSADASGRVIGRLAVSAPGGGDKRNP